MPFSRIQIFLACCCRVVVLAVAVHTFAHAADDTAAQPNLFQVLGKFFSGKVPPASDSSADTAAPAPAPAIRDTRSLAAPPSEKRVALVIGNAAYPGPAALRNPANDATDMAAKLKKLGFDVTLKTDIPLRQMLRTLTEFGDKVTNGTEALFFYAGHGMQVKGRNYLIPIDAQIGTESSVSSEAVDVDQLLDKLSHARLSMVILDACRNNPFERRFRGGGQGLAQINAPTGTLIAYATAPGKVAADGDGRNGLYTAELLKAMDIPGIKVEDVFKRVRANVVEKSGDAQTPWESSSLTGDFYFIFQDSATVNVQQAPTDPETEVWQAAQHTDTLSAYRAYLDAYPNGRYAVGAKIRIDALKKPAAAEPAKPAVSSAPTIVAVPDDPEGALWAEVKSSGTKEYYTAYLNQFPKGKYASLAKVELKKIREIDEKKEALERERTGGRSKHSEFLEGRWQAEILNNEFQMLVRWNPTTNQYEGVLAAQGTGSASVGFTIGETIWTAKPTSNPDRLNERQMLRSSAQNYRWLEGELDLNRSTEDELVTSFAQFRRIGRRNTSRQRVDSPVADSASLEIVRLNSPSAPLAPSAALIKGALKRTIGSEKRWLIVIQEPNCKYCKQLEAELNGLTDISIYTHVIAFSPEAAIRLEAILCSANPALSWVNWMIYGVEPTFDKPCRTLDLEKTAEVKQLVESTQATPRIIFPDGSSTTGFLKANVIDEHLNKIFRR